MPTSDETTLRMTYVITICETDLVVVDATHYFVVSIFYRDRPDVCRRAEHLFIYKCIYYKHI